jgi:hypothetical protein
MTTGDDGTRTSRVGLRLACSRLAYKALVAAAIRPGPSDRDLHWAPQPPTRAGEETGKARVQPSVQQSTARSGFESP